MVYEPKIYALLVGSIHGQALHIGVHFSLDEAYAAAKIKMLTMGVYRPQDSVNLELWNTLDINVILDGEVSKIMDENLVITEPIVTKNIIEPVVEERKSVEDSIKGIKDMKNNLMKKLIESGDIQQVAKATDILSINSRRYVLKAIKEKNNSSIKSKHV